MERLDVLIFFLNSCRDKIVSERLKKGNAHEYMMDSEIMDESFREIIKKNG